MKHELSVWITANAGSGKTTYLTRRVVALLLMGVEPERICCITYTKAAASEMRHRVLSQLRDLLVMDEVACATRIQAILGHPATPADIARARSLFGLVLDSPTGGLALTTIHGFCQNILRRFPLEAGINPHFTVLEEVAADRLIARQKNRLLGNYNADNTLLNAALTLIAERMKESRFDEYIAAIIGKRRQWETIWRSQSPESLKRKIYALHGLGEGVNSNTLTAQLLNCIGDTDEAVIRAHLPQLESHANKTERENAIRFTAWLEVEAEHRAGQIDEFLLIFLTKERTPRASILAKSFADGSPLREAMNRIAEHVQGYQQQTAALASAEESFAVAILARELLFLYAYAKEEIHALDYDDQIAKVRELFANPSLLGWIMSKLDHRIDHLLIDEAQDTSAEQWSITDLLVEELIASNEGVGSGGIPRSVLVVGDEKQSIYSFQGAAPELFSAMRTQFQEKLEHSYSPLRLETLSNSYRSAEAVLTLVDHVATMPEIASALSTEGEAQPHRLIRTQAAGSVTLHAPVHAPEKIAMPPLQMPTEYQIAQTAAQQLADKIADTVKEWLEGGRLLESEGRPIRPGDILMLVYKRSTLVLPLIRALQRRGIPVAGLDRLKLSHHLAVRDLLALMRWVGNLADDLSLAQVLRSPIIGISDEQLRALCVNRSASLWAALGGHPILDHALKNRDCTPYEFLTTILETKGTRRVFAQRFGEEVHEVLDELKAQAASMPQGIAPTLTSFYDWLAGSDREIKREQETGETNHVRIMTVHGAKGLEAPVVMLVDTVRVPDTRHEMFFFTQDASHQMLPALAISDDGKRAPIPVTAKQAKIDALFGEYYRLLYVALTRARDEMHVFGTADKKGELKKGSWYAVVAQAMDELGAKEEGDCKVLRDARVPAPRKEAAPDAQYVSLPAWAHASAPALKDASRVLAPSQLAGETVVSVYVESGDGSERARGVLIHRMLELLEAHTDKTTIVRLSELIAPEWSAEERKRITHQIAELLAAENWIWASPSQAEVNIAGTVMMEGVAIPVSGQIDRLIETPEAMVILDYKTGWHVPADAAGISETYRLQLKTYHALVSRLRPQKPVRCAILWTATGQLMWCDAEVAATPWKTSLAA